jgi:ATP-binding cassette subfamily F protein uup
VTDHVIAIVDEKLAFLPGGVPEYLNRRAAAGGSGGRPPWSAQRGSAAPKQTPRPGRVPDQSCTARLREAKKELARLDRQLERLTGLESELHEALTAAATDYARLVELGEELRAVEAEKAAVEDRWLQLAEETSA